MSADTVLEMALLVEGAPRGKGRPRFGNGRTWTDAETITAEGEIRRVWEENGSPRLDGPIRLRVTLVVERPKGHFLSDGISLSAEGRRHPLPENRKPDVDNALKLVMDALNSRAWRDDVQVVDARVRRRWGSRPATHVYATEVAVLESDTPQEG